MPSRKVKVLFRIYGKWVKKPYKCLHCVPTSYYESYGGALSHSQTGKHRNDTTVSVCNERLCVYAVTKRLPEQDAHRCAKMVKLSPEEAAIATGKNMKNAPVVYVLDSAKATGKKNKNAAPVVYA